MTATQSSILFIHGFLDGAAVWERVVATLGARATNSIRVDLAGMGARASDTGPFTLERFAADIGKVVDSLDKPVVIVGHSMGAQVAELVAASHASRVSALVLATPVPLAGALLPKEESTPFRMLGGQPASQRALRRQLCASLDDERLEELGAIGDLPAPDTVAAFADTWNRGHADGAQPSRYAGPVLLMLGERDPFVTAEVIESVVTRFDDPEIAVVENAGHWPHVEQPAPFADFLAGFLDKVDATAASPAQAPSAGWTAAFESKSAQAFSEAFAPGVVLEASALRHPVEGRDQVKTVMAAASSIYTSLSFTRDASHSDRHYLEWEATAFEGTVLRGVTILTKNDDGKIVRAAIHHRPLDGALKFSAELGRRLQGKVDASHFYSAT